MCGFAGYFGKGSWNKNGYAENLLKAMGEAITSRGPDAAGVWQDGDAAIGLSHRRLSILDLSAAGAQPMMSESGRYVISFNGEVYNHNKLREELDIMHASPKWKGHSDTETLLAGFEKWGIEATINKSEGMFGLAVWDQKDKTLSLIRDRMGEKPVYYGWIGEGEKKCFVFGSQLKALRKHPSFKQSLNRDSLKMLMQYNYIPTPYSIYDGIKKLEPGTILTLPLGKSEPEIQKYWSVADGFDPEPAYKNHRDDRSIVDGLENLLLQVIGDQMIADVPLGAFLSGGIDSSAVVALMQVQSERPVKTFTIGFEEKGYNEAVHARAVAKHLGTEHTELYVSPKHAMDVIPLIPEIYDEPFSDSSQIPTILVSKLARQDVTVSLSGDGGDELFCGYNRYVMTENMWSKIRKIPSPLRVAMKKSIEGVSPASWDMMASFVPFLNKKVNIGDKLHKGASVFCGKSYSALYEKLISHWDKPESIVLQEKKEISYAMPDSLHKTFPIQGIESMMLLDMMTYLPDDILTKVDRAAMSVSLETRVPFLNHKVVEYASGMPFETKLRGGVGKWALREVLYRHVPRDMMERPKMGFGVPIGAWLRGPLREWAEELIDPSRLSQEGYFNTGIVQKKWEEHLSGKRNWAYHLWDVLMFQAWLENQ